MIYLFIIVLLLILSFHYDIKGRKSYRNQWYDVMLVVFILLAGLRWRLGVDTPNYLERFYYDYPTLNNFSFNDFLIGADPLWVLLNSLVKSIGGRFYMVQLVQATIVNVLIFKYIKKHSRCLFTCLFFYFLICYIDYNMEIMRGSISIAICLFANDYIMEKKWIKGYLLYCLALCFHGQTIIIFFLPTLFFLRLNRTSIYYFIVAIIGGYFLQKSLGQYLDLLDMTDPLADKVELYMNTDKYGAQTHNLNYMIVYIFPKLIYGLLSLWYVKKFFYNSKLLVLEPFILLGTIFLLFQMNSQIAYRYVDYYLLYLSMFLAEFLVGLTRKMKMPKGFAYVHAFVILLPFIIFMSYIRISKSVRYYPYSSVIERSVDLEREFIYQKNYNVISAPRKNEY